MCQLALGTMALIMGIYLPHFNINTLIITKIISFLIGFLISASMLFYTLVNEISSDSTLEESPLVFLNTGVFLFNTFVLFIPYMFITYVSKDFFTYLWILPVCMLISILLLYFIKDTNPGRRGFSIDHDCFKKRKREINLFSLDNFMDHFRSDAWRDNPWVKNSTVWFNRR